MNSNYKIKDYSLSLVSFLYLRYIRVFYIFITSWQTLLYFEKS